MNEPDHEDVAVREVQQLQDAVDQGIAERDECVGAALGEPVERELDERVHGRAASLVVRRGGPALAPDRPSSHREISLTTLYEPLDWICMM